LATIGSSLSAAHPAATAPTAALVPAAADEVSAGIAHLFSRYAEDFRGLAGRAAVFHEQFVQQLNAGAHSYAGAEAVNVSWLLWLAGNAGLYTAFRTLFEMLESNSIILQMLQNFVQPLRFLLGGILFLLFWVAIGISEILSGFLGKFGL
jgi:PE family